MSNILNEPQNDLFEDTFWEALGDIKDGSFIPNHLLKYAVNLAHIKCGGEVGDESYAYGKLLLREQGYIVQGE